MFIEYIICVFVMPVNAKLSLRNVYTCVVLCMLRPVIDDCWIKNVQVHWARAPADVPLKIPFSVADLDSHLTYCSLGSHESVTKTASRSVQPFCTAHLCVEQTTIHTTSVVIGHIYAVRAGDSA